MARTPLNAKVVCDEFAGLTTIVVSPAAPKNRVSALGKQVNVLVAPVTKVVPPSERSIRNLPRRSAAKAGPQRPFLNLRWLMKQLGSENVTSILVEGGGETNASFLFDGLAHRVAFFYAPRILGGSAARKAVAGEGVKSLSDAIQLRDVEWKTIGEDLMMTARITL
jgi:diaminohydroxyphosphoribosylaminopyrimidine deaminase/5-amino-6-(5-phosphoribosylamino)uracil reductase